MTSENKKLLISSLAVIGIGAAGFYFLTRDRNPPTLHDVKWQQQYLLSTHQLHQIAKNLQLEMDNGLKGEKSTLKMLPSYVTKPVGDERGAFLALDLGGTNFRVIKCVIEDGIIKGGSKRQFTISESIMRGNSFDLFNFIAQCVQNFIQSENLSGVRVIIGFTFSFPVNQTSVNSGTLIQWTKGFTTEGVEGHDVVELLTEAFIRNNVNAHVAALVNDTVGTMVARSYEDTKCEMGLILGTGSNACYIEETKNITKMGPVNTSTMIINMEWGGFGDRTNFLPLSVEDKIMDAASLNPGQQIFEKQISGMYLGEISRLFIISLIERGIIHSIHSSSIIHQRNKFHTSYMTVILKDETKDLTDVIALLQEKFGIVNTTLTDRHIVRQVSHLVASRAARLSAAAVVAVLEKIGRLNQATVAVDGGVFEHLPGFKSEMEKAIKEMHPLSSVFLELTTDGSGNGAAIIAAVVVNTHSL